MSSFEIVKEILDEAVGGPQAPVGSPHGSFWRGKTRDEFVQLQVRGFGRQEPLLVLNDGAGSNLVKALKGEEPFGQGALYRRMPGRRPPVPAEKIAVIQQWIDDGCPES